MDPLIEEQPIADQVNQKHKNSPQVGYDRSTILEATHE